MIMTGFGAYEFLLWFSSTMCLICVLSEYVPVDNYLIDCGSPNNVSVGNRVFVADNFHPKILSTPLDISLNTSLKSIASRNDSDLFQTARIFNGTSHYSFPIQKHGRHWIRLYLFPFANGNYNLSMAKFSVSSQNFTLLREFQPQSGPVVKEYTLNITSDVLVLTITPSANSFAFLNALEVFSLPDEVIPDGADTINLPNKYQAFSRQALETIARVNMGNQTVPVQDDTLWRLWVPDGPYLSNENFVKFEAKIDAVNYSRGWPSPNIAPASVYGTVTRLITEQDPNIRVNMTWFLDVDPGFEYLVRLHFCDFVTSPPKQIFLTAYINSWLVEQNIDLSRQTSSLFGAPYYIDAVVRLNESPVSISIAPSTLFYLYSDAILNGLEIMKLSNSGGSLSSRDAEFPSLSPSSNSKPKVWLIVGAVGGASLTIVLLAFVFFLVRRIRRRRVHGHSIPDHVAMTEARSSDAVEGKYPNGNTIISSSKFGYRFPFVAIQEATNNFSGSLVVGLGGFGKVYRGILKDGTKVAVKRGISRSQQGLSEFKTEIEMLSQFKHRHLVSLIGYCDEQNEMIILYEYMENGTLRSHLYDSDLPCLSWRQRLEICIGSAKGLHYLHTGSAKAIIHRDVKSANILLDENLMAKVADFGISRNGPDFDETHVSTAVKGSFGYLDPEYLTTRQLTEKSDTYSFGVVMLEVLCGRPVIDPSLPMEMVNLVECAMELQKKGELEKATDPRLTGEIMPDSLRKFGEIAMKCLAKRGIDRPTMGDILWNLECALQLQGSDNRHNPNGRLTQQANNSHLETSSTTQFSTPIMGDLAGVSMSRVFSQMVKAEVRRMDDM